MNSCMKLSGTLLRSRSWTTFSISSLVWGRKWSIHILKIISIYWRKYSFRILLISSIFTSLGLDVNIFFFTNSLSIFYSKNYFMCFSVLLFLYPSTRMYTFICITSIFFSVISCTCHFSFFLLPYK